MIKKRKESIANTYKEMGHTVCLYRVKYGVRNGVE